MELTTGVYDVAPPKRGYLKAGYSKAVIVDSGDGLIVIDTLYDADAKDILDEMKRMGKGPADIKHIVLTHAHRGHLGGLATLKRLSGAPVYAHPWEADIISAQRSRQEPSVFVTTPIQSYPIIFFGRLTAAINKHIPLAVDVLIEEGDSIGPLQAVHTPGHTPGHLAFYWPERRVFITGDAFVTWPIHCPGWPNAMLNHEQSWETLNKMAEFDAEIIAPGHGDSITKNGAAALRALAARGKV
ncbi:MAG: MBL fold metallo-hydrolase [Candidatus Promineofilum sp.]|nr:MBL fold metallo-hydrolase [Promineifilum sp.]